MKVDKTTYSESTKRMIAQNWSEDIKRAAQESPELRKEIARTFQQANRRIQNLQNAKGGVISPALAALGERATIDSYSKFRIGAFGHTEQDWKELKEEYGRAIAFLNQPTSTVKGAREFEKHVKDGIFSGSQMSDEGKEIFWDAIKDNVINGFNDVAPNMLGAMRYTDIMQEIYDRAIDDSANLIERLAIQAADELQSDIDTQAYKIAVETFNSIDEFFDSLFDSFGRL